jgi:hypothetical protein
VKKRTWGIETSQYPEEKKSNEIPRVVASEIGGAQRKQLRTEEENDLGRSVKESESLVSESQFKRTLKSRSAHVEG